MKRTSMLFAMMMMSLFSYTQIIQFIDHKFKNALVMTNCVDTNGDGIGDIRADINNNGEIEIKEVDSIEALVIIGGSPSGVVSAPEFKYFKNLRYLNFSKNSLGSTSGIEECKKLKYLDLSWNHMYGSRIDSLKNLEYLNLKSTSASELNTENCVDLKYLNISNTQIRNIDLSSNTKLETYINEHSDIRSDSINFSSNKKLKYLSTTSNYFNNYINLSENIELDTLILSYCSFNNLDLRKNVNLKFLNTSYCSSLQNLDLTHNLKLKSLYFRANWLNTIDLSNNHELQFIDFADTKMSTLLIKNKPKLKYLNLRTCRNLESFEIIDSPELLYLDCLSSKFNSLDLSKCYSLDSLICGSLDYLNIKNGSNENYIDIWFDSRLKYLCVDEFQLEEVRKKIYKDVVVNSYCTFSHGGKLFENKGSIFYDLDNNGCDNNDIYAKCTKFQLESLGKYENIFSNTSGIYFIPVQEGTHTIKPILENPDYFNVSPDSIIITFPSTSDTFIQDFCITPKGILRAIDLSIIPTTVARPGFDAKYKVVMTNKGNQVENGTLYFSYDEEKMDFVSTDVNPSSRGDGLLSWNFTDLLPFETRYYNVTLNVNSPSETPPVNAGDELLITCNILDNVFLLKQEVVGSYDPNDKTCLEGKTITPEQVGEYVHYLIRFENTGNYAAENVVVKDVIDETTFDISTLQITDASHEAWARINGNIVEFIFENIQLPFDDASNDGYICFKIKTKPTLVLGNELKNEANIYFDYNLPILTNKTNTVVANLVGTDEAIGDSVIEVFPNPVSDVLKFSSDDKILKVEIFDMSGRLVQVSNVVDGEVNVERLLSGAYQMKVYTQIGVINTKMVKI